MQKQLKAYWPSPQDYNEAIQNPALSFACPELASALPVLDEFGLPRPNTGMFASVYQMQSSSVRGSAWATRCFLSFVADQKERYAEICKTLEAKNFDFMLQCGFQEKGILVGGLWYPLLKMQWCNGLTLDNWLKENLNSADNLELFLLAFKELVFSMRAAGVAHGDLQHANILLCGQKIVLVDYDCMYVPGLFGMQSNELGHRDYQHPGRDSSCFGPELDNFSSWVIYLSVLILIQDPQIWKRLACGEDALIFRQKDFIYPNNSFRFWELENHPDTVVSRSAKLLRYFCLLPYEELPPLGEYPADLETLLSPLQCPYGGEGYSNVSGLGGQMDFENAAETKGSSGSAFSSIGKQDEDDWESMDQGPLSRAKKRQRGRRKGGFRGGPGQI